VKRLASRSRVCAISTSGGFAAVGIPCSGGPHPVTFRAIFCFAWYRLQADRYGDLDDENRRLLDHSETPETAARRALGSTRRSTEVRPGTVFSREWNGQMNQVTVLANGFAWSSKTYPSLSKVAFAITGSRWNGPRFFGLRDKQSKVPVS
jgi:Protein of unknown function (DUF2924)